MPLPEDPDGSVSCSVTVAAVVVDDDGGGADTDADVCDVEGEGAVDNNAAALSGEALLTDLAGKIHYPDVTALIQHGVDALEEMRQLEILTGTRASG